MKKIITILVIVAVVSSSAFATSNYIGISLGPSFGRINENVKVKAQSPEIAESFEKELSKKYSEYGLVLALDGANYFASISDVDLGMAYQAGGTFDFAVLDGKTHLKGHNNTFYIRPALAIAYNLNKALALEFRFGPGYNYAGIEKKLDDVKSTATVQAIELFGSFGINMALSESWGIRAGIQVGGNIWSSVNAKVDGKDLSTHLNELIGKQDLGLDPGTAPAPVEWIDASDARVDSVTSENEIKNATVNYNHVYFTPYVGFTYSY